MAALLLSISDFEKYLPNAIGSLLSGVVAIIIFLSGNALSRKREREKEARRLNEFAERINHLGKTTISAIEIQTRNLSLFLKQIREDKQFNVFTENALLGSLIEEFYKENHADIYKIFITNGTGSVEERSVLLNTLNKNFYILRGIKENTKGHIKLLMADLKEHNKSWEKHLNDIFRLFEKYSQVYISNKSLIYEDRFFKELDSICKRISNKIGDLDANSIRREFLSPIQELCNQNRGDKRSVEVIQTVLNAKRAYTHTLHAKYDIGMVVISRMRALRNAKEELRKIFNKNSCT